MRVLAVETSTLTGSVALLEEERLVAEITLSVSLQHSERLMPAIESLLQSAGCDLKEIDLFAAATGPGSFTGLRVGIAAVQGLAAATGKPAVGVSTLQALSLNAAYFPGIVIPVLDGRRGESYIGAYRIEEGVPQTVLEDQAVPTGELPQKVNTLLEPRLLLTGSVPRASNVGTLALKFFRQGVQTPFLPRYLRSAS